MSPDTLLPTPLQIEPFNLSYAKAFGISRYQIQKMLASGKLERLGRGLFRCPKETLSKEDEFQMASLWIGKPSAICLLSALAYYQLCDEIPQKTWIMVPHSKLSKHKNLHLVRLRSPQWELGIDKNPGFCMTNIPRSIADAFAHPQIVGTQIALKSLKKAIHENLTSIKDIYEIALQLRIGHRVLPYVELFS